MVLIVEDGTGLATANSYITRADAELYFERHLYGDAWNVGASYSKKETALMMATRVIDTNTEFHGFVKNDIQALKWPRIRVPNIERYNFTFAGPVVLAPFFDSNSVPQRVKDATCELALALLTVDRTKDDEASGISQLTVTGAIAITFDHSNRKRAMPEQVMYMLQPLGRFRFKRTSARVVRGQ
jgi:hypothetical protein